MEISNGLDHVVLAGRGAQNRMQCATFHILTPYPGTQLFWQMDAEGRLLHRNWDLYDTAHVVFRPKRMSPEELLLGYDWLYRRLFSHASIWRRRPREWGAVPPYLAGCYLYKRSNRPWHSLIKHRLVRMVWWPLVEMTPRGHLMFRRRLERQEPVIWRWGGASGGSFVTGRGLTWESETAPT